MIRRFVCFLLIPLLLANQGLAVAHSHRGDVVEPEGHGSRPHFHVGSHGHHDSASAHAAAHSHAHHFDGNGESGHPDESLPPAIMPFGDHEAGAMYFAGAVILARGGTTLCIVPAKFIALSTVYGVAEPTNDSLPRLGPIRSRPPSDGDTGCPIYLRTLSLRI